MVAETGKIGISSEIEAERKSILYALLAAAFYAVNVPLSKLLLGHVGPVMMAALALGFVAYGLSIFLYGHCTPKHLRVSFYLPWTILINQYWHLYCSGRFGCCNHFLPERHP